MDMDYQKRMDERDRRVKSFMEDRFGMFIHWGLYAIPGRGEWLMNNAEIPREEYEQYAKEWDPKHFDAKAWARLAKKAGMKYAVLTTKHHDGFCLFDSKLTDYKSTNTPFGRDIVREFSDAFRAEGLKVGFYYSLLDWHHPDYPVKGDPYHPERNRPDAAEGNFEAYLDYLHGQVEELMSNYGKIDILWFDFSYDDKSGEGWRGTELLKMVRRLQPDIILNGRLEGSGGHYGSVITDQPGPLAGDFACPEMLIPPDGLKTESGRQVPWEACLSINNQWGYVPTDLHRKTATQLIRKLVECVGKNGNMILNVGPDAKGRIPGWQREVLEEMGAWLERFGDSIYGCGSVNLPKPDWGRYTGRGKTIYCHVFDPPLAAIPLAGLKNQVARARRLEDGLEMSLGVPWDLEIFPDYEFVNYGKPEFWTFALGNEIDEVIELRLKDEAQI